MRKKIQVEIKYDNTHPYIQEKGSGDLMYSVQSLLAVHGGAVIIAGGIYSDWEENNEGIIMTVEFNKASSALLELNSNVFVDAVLGEKFKEEHGITEIIFADHEAVMLAAQRYRLENSWD